MSDSLPASVSIGDSALYQDLDDEVVLLNMTSQEYYGLNDVATRMWKSLLETQSVAATAERLVQIYDVDPNVLRADLEKLVRNLLNAGLLKSA